MRFSYSFFFYIIYTLSFPDFEDPDARFNFKAPLEIKKRGRVGKSSCDRSHARRFTFNHPARNTYTYMIMHGSVNNSTTASVSFS